MDSDIQPINDQELVTEIQKLANRIAASPTEGPMIKTLGSVVMACAACSGSPEAAQVFYEPIQPYLVGVMDAITKGIKRQAVKKKKVRRKPK